MLFVIKVGDVGGLSCGLFVVLCWVVLFAFACLCCCFGWFPVALLSLVLIYLSGCFLLVGFIVAFAGFGLYLITYLF